jgi:hypothetical protein
LLRFHHKLVERYQNSTVTRTYKLPEPLVERLNAMAKAHRVGVSDLVGFLLTDGLNRIESGELKLKTRPLDVRVIEYVLE